MRWIHVLQGEIWLPAQPFLPNKPRKKLHRAGRLQELLDADRPLADGTVLKHEENK